MLGLTLILLLNILISWANCYFVGKTWRLSKRIGGIFHYGGTWGAFVMACIGFSMPLILLFGAAGYAAVPSIVEYMPDMVAKSGKEAVEVIAMIRTSFWKGTTAIWYLAIIVPLLGFGLIMTCMSWAEFMKSRSVIDGLGAAYNTYAMANNAYRAYSEVPKQASVLGDLISGAFDGENPLAGIAIVALVLAVLVAVSALFAGALIATALVNYYSKRDADARHYAGLPHSERAAAR